MIRKFPINKPTNVDVVRSAIAVRITSWRWFILFQGVLFRRTKITTAAIQVLLGCIALCMTSCQSPPGEGWKAESGFRHAAPVVAALERFRQDRGTYPTELEDLVPTYLSSDKLLLPPPLHAGIQRIRSTASRNPRMFSYDQEGNGYTLRFEYEGPGRNYCIYDSQVKTWHSGGYY